MVNQRGKNGFVCISEQTNVNDVWSEFVSITLALNDGGHLLYFEYLHQVLNWVSHILHIQLEMESLTELQSGSDFENSLQRFEVEL